MTADRTDPERNPSLAGLAARALDQMRGLLRREVDMARVELDDSLSEAGAALGLLAGALVIVLAALNVLAAALVVALAELGLGAGWAAVAVGLALALIGGGMAARGMADLRRAQLAPKQTARRLKDDARAAKEAVHG